MLRRSFLAGIAGLALHGTARAAGADYWYSVRGEDGADVPNLHLSAEQISGVATLPGLIRGAGSPGAVEVVEFFDYNCPVCRRMAPELEALTARDGRIRLSFVNIPVLSPFSVEAAKVELAVRKLHGSATAAAFHERLIGQKGVANAARSLDVVAAMGLPRPAVEAAMAEAGLERDIAAHIRMADGIGFDVTPSFVIADAGIPGYPGAKVMARMVESTRSCGVIECQG